MKLLKFCSLVILSLSVLSSCKKEATYVSIQDQEIKGGPIPPYLFNWETATYVPTSPTNQIQMPWNSGSTAIDPSIVSDYKKNDGWVMLWNTFSPTRLVSSASPSSPLFFSLYNKYRGLLRFYIWQNATSVGSSYLTHGLQQYTTGTLTNILNFNGQEIIDASKKEKSFNSVLRQPFTINSGSWCVMQYEIAYDPSIATTTFPAYGLGLNGSYTTVTTASFSGLTNGSINGTVGATPDQTPGQFFQSLGQSAVGTFLSNWQSIVTGDIGTAISNATAGIISGFLNGIVGGISGNPGKAISLTINQKITISGNLISEGGFLNIKLVLPGQSNVSTADGNIPDYKQALGVFNLASKPIVYYTLNETSQTIEDPYSQTTCTENFASGKYYFNTNSFNIQWNPAIINSTSTGATIANLKKEFIIVGNKGETSGTSGEKIGDNWQVITSKVNPTAQTPLSYSWTTYSTCFYGTPPQPADYFVRISFDVIPNTPGTAKTTIVKTFRPTMTRL